MAIDKASGQVRGHAGAGQPRTRRSGEGAAFLAEARDVVLKTLEECTEEERKDPWSCTEIIRADLKRFFRKRTGTRPMIVPVIIEI